MGHQVGKIVIAEVNSKLRCKACGVCPSRDFQCVLSRCPGRFVRESAINYRTAEGQRRARMRYDEA